MILLAMGFPLDEWFNHYCHGVSLLGRHWDYYREAWRGCQADLLAISPNPS
jgi:hypothetical protein